MRHKQRIIASSRIALAALLHDLGKFAERARIPEAQARNADGTTRQAIDELLACPEWNGRRTHIHAAYTGIAFDSVVPRELRQEDDLFPFAGWGSQGADDSLINAAARHHRPETFLQWIIASADRLASGFERDEFDAYNKAADEEGKKLNHYTTRQWTLLEDVRLPGSEIERGTPTVPPAWRYPLKALSPEAIFPVAAKDCETDDKATAQARYLDLWNQFQAGLKAIPASHRTNLPLWLDHFDSIWLAFTHAIPSATAGNTRPDVSLYDHSRTTAALAVALWRFHADQGHDAEVVKEQLRAQWDRERAGHDAARQAWEAEKFLLVQGDFTGIQDFIFAGGESQRQVARLLRGRSFHVSLLSELAALKVLETLDLPATSQVVNAAGKFLIVAPNTLECVAKLRVAQSELDDWFLKHTYGQSGINLAWLPARADDFRHGQGESPFRGLIKRLFEALEAAKLTRFGLCGATPPPANYSGFLSSFKREQGECRIDGRSPAQVPLDSDWISELAWDQIMTGKWLAGADQRLLITRDRIEPLSGDQNLNQLRLPIFGYHVLFTRPEDITGKFGDEARSGNLARAWDFSLPESADAPLWNGYARRAINAYVPKFRETDLAEASYGKYNGLSTEDRDNERPGAAKTLNHLARDDRFSSPETPDKWIGAEALITLKGDIDNLGLIFQQGQERPTFARMAALSRQINAFFTVWLPWVCRQEFPNTYTVFAGGDDFFLIGPWRSTMRLAQRMRDEFARYVAHNPDIHFSAGLSMTKPGLPIRQLGQLVEDALDAAKAYLPFPASGGEAGGEGKHAPKNAVTCFGQSVPWTQFNELMDREAVLGQLSKELNLSTGYLYGLLHFTDMAADQCRPENALWHSRFAYRTQRMLEAKFRNEGNRDTADGKRRHGQRQLAAEIASQGIEKHGAAYKIALFTHLYQQRD